MKESTLVVKRVRSMTAYMLRSALTAINMDTREQNVMIQRYVKGVRRISTIEIAKMTTENAAVTDMRNTENY